MRDEVSFTLFNDISSKEVGACLFFEGISSKIHHCMFYNCFTTSYAAGICSIHCSLKILYCCFSKCLAIRAMAISLSGTNNNKNELKFLSTDACSIIPESSLTDGSTIYISYTNGYINNLNSTNNNVNHIGTSQNYLCSNFELLYCNSISNKASLEGVINQLHDTPANLLKFSNFVSNFCGNLAVIRCVTESISSSTILSDCNFVNNDSPQIVSTFVIANNCYHDGQSIFGTVIQNAQAINIQIQSQIITCIYYQSKLLKLIPNNLLKLISSFFILRS